MHEGPAGRRGPRASGSRRGGVGTAAAWATPERRPSRWEGARCRCSEKSQPRYVCDTTGDVNEAKAAGATVVGAGWDWRGEERLLRAAPDLIARRPSDLLDLL